MGAMWPGKSGPSKRKPTVTDVGEIDDFLIPGWGQHRLMWWCAMLSGGWWCGTVDYEKFENGGSGQIVLDLFTWVTQCIVICDGGLAAIDDVCASTRGYWHGPCLYSCVALFAVERCIFHFENRPRKIEPNSNATVGFGLRIISSQPKTPVTGILLCRL